MDTGYAGLPLDDPRIRDLRRAFYSLARVGEEGQFTCRTARWSQMPATCTDVVQRFIDQRLLVSGAENGTTSLTVAHEALFRVWDTLKGWLLQDRKALALRSHIEDAAAEWQAENQAESCSWAEERIIDAIREITRSGVSLDDVASPTTVRAFLGPTDPDEIATLLALIPAEEPPACSGRYGDAWRLPLDHETRASAGERLALLGDARRGVGLRTDGLPDIDWCRIEDGQGVIEIRSNPDDPNSKIAKTLRRPVNTFWMARYPITVAQFQAFLQDCCRDDIWRLPPESPVDLPAGYLPPKHRARYGNHPADNVNRLDAAAFCHWLGAHFGCTVRLPTEYEWHLAATAGDTTRIYPWGAKWDLSQEPWRANTTESRLNRATAVGLYPLGASPAGLQDMAGTLWEWCENPFEHPDDAGRPWLGRLFAKHRETSLGVLRGGSWGYDRDSARSAYRLWRYPLNRSVSIGFRVVRSSSPEDLSRSREDILVGGKLLERNASHRILDLMEYVPV